MGPFSYRCDDKENVLPHWGPTEIEPNVFYEGQWKNSLRHGKGKQFWSDGAFYEGYW